MTCPARPGQHWATMQSQVVTGTWTTCQSHMPARGQPMRMAWRRSAPVHMSSLCTLQRTGVLWRSALRLHWPEPSA